MKSLTVLLVGCVIAAGAGLAATAADAPLSVISARVTIDGTSNIHPYTASSKAVRLTRVQLATAGPSGDVLQQAVQPGALEAFDIAVAASSLASPKGDIDKNMHKALKVQEHADITFRLRTLDTGTGEGAAGIPLKAAGTLTIAGVAREVTLDVKAVRQGETLTLTGGVDLLMTDFGVTPPKAMLGMLKTDPKVHVGFELVVAAS
jgi:polyisoprenoid-binding protein YceI